MIREVAKLIDAIGALLVIDDYKDYGKFDRIHHWFIGELMREGALLLYVVGAWLESSSQ